MAEFDTIITVPVAPASMQTGTRSVIVDENHVCHVVLRPEGTLTLSTEMSFTAEQAISIAKAVLAGEPRACTSSAALRLLAAAFLTCSLDEPEAESAAPVLQ